MRCAGGAAKSTCAPAQRPATLRAVSPAVEHRVDRPAPSDRFASLWKLDPKVLYLNHGSFGACPAAVLRAQARLRAEMEREPVDFLDGALAGRLDAARATLARLIGADAADVVFVPNATTAVNAVLRSLTLEPGDELLLTSQTYGACRKSAQFVAARAGAQVVTARVPFPLRTEGEVLAAVLAAVSPRTRLALVDHVTSPTALVLPVERLVSELSARRVDTLIDGAHAPGMVPLDLRRIAAAYYTGNAHKWLCAPKGAAFLHVRADRHARVHPTVISHGYGGGLRAEFDWTGTCDPTPWLCIPAALEHLGAALPGGWPQLMARNRALALAARAVLLDALGVAPPCPESMIGSMASILLPAPRAGAPAEGLDCRQLHGWLRARHRDVAVSQAGAAAAHLGAAVQRPRPVSASRRGAARVLRRWVRGPASSRGSRPSTLPWWSSAWWWASGSSARRPSWRGLRAARCCSSPPGSSPGPSIWSVRSCSPRSARAIRVRVATTAWSRIAITPRSPSCSIGRRPSCRARARRGWRSSAPITSARCCCRPAT